MAGTLTAPDDPGTTFSVVEGGAAGSRSVAFRLTGGGIATTTAPLVLSAEYAISAAGSGSVTRTVKNQSLAVLTIPGVGGTMTREAPGVIRLGSGLKETAMAMDATATVEHGFRSFGGAAVANLGSLRVTFDGDVKQATGSTTGEKVDALSQIIDVQGKGDDAGTVGIMGDFSFARRWTSRRATPRAGWQAARWEPIPAPRSPWATW